MERRCLAGSPWSVQACVDLSLLGVSAGIVFRFHHIKTLKKILKNEKVSHGSKLACAVSKNLSQKKENWGDSSTIKFLKKFDTC